MQRITIDLSAALAADQYLVADWRLLASLLLVSFQQSDGCLIASL